MTVTGSNTRTRSLFTLLAVAVASHVDAGGDVNVPADFATIQAAIDAASAVTPSAITVAPGVYVENLDFGGKPIALVSEEGAATTVIAPGSGTAVELGPDATFEGFTVRDAIASFGAGISVRGTGSRIAGNIFEDNTQTAGGFGSAIGGNGASALVENNVFRNNSCDNQFVSGVVVFVNGSSPVIQNNVFVDNPCRAINWTLPAGSQPLVINNTMVRNRVGVRVDRRISATLQVFRNNIIVDNEIGLEIDFGVEDFNPTWEHNLVFGNGIDYEEITDQTGSNGNLSAPPLFADALANDFRLTIGSPAIDAGTPDAAPDADFDGNPRPVNGDADGVAQFDIGALEFSFGPDQDVDGDNIANEFDNCADIANASQLDTDQDGFGNLCDGDFNNDCATNVLDLGIIRNEFFQVGELATDMNGDGVVNNLDLGQLRRVFFLPPGPSGLADCAAD